MAYSKVLEELIEAALADGVLTDKERAVLHKRARQEGVDPDEIDVVIEGRLSKMKRQEDWLKPMPPATEKRGNIVKCPNCGATIEAGAVACKECGYVFTNVAANRSSEKLAEKISFLLHSRANEGHIIEEIKNFPLPTGKEDLMEFIASMDAKRKEQGPLQQAYRTKFNESIIKAKTFFSHDAQVMGMVKALDKFSISSLTKIQKIIGATSVAIIILMIIFLSNMIMSNIAANNAEPLAKAQYEELMSKLDELETPNATNYKETESQLRKITWTDIEGDKSTYKENYLSKKCAIAKQILSVYIELDELYLAPNDIQSPESYIEN